MSDEWHPLFRLVARESPAVAAIHELSLDGVPLVGVTEFCLSGSMGDDGDGLMELHLELLPSCEMEARVEVVLTPAQHEQLRRMLEHAKVSDR